MKTKPVLAEDTSPKGPVGKIRTKKKKPSKEAKSSKSRAKKAVDLPREELEGSIQVETRGSSKEKKRDKSKSKMDNKKPSSKGRKRVVETDKSSQDFNSLQSSPNQLKKSNPITAKEPSLKPRKRNRETQTETKRHSKLTKSPEAKPKMGKKRGSKEPISIELGEPKAKMVKNPSSKGRKGKKADKIDIIKFKEVQSKALSALDNRLMENVDEIEDSMALIIDHSHSTITEPYAGSILFNRCFSDLKARTTLEKRPVYEKFDTPRNEKLRKIQNFENFEKVPEESEGKGAEVGGLEGMGMEEMLGRVERVFNYMREHQDPTTTHYTQMMGAYLDAGQHDNAMQTYMKMTQDNRKPDTGACNLIIRTFLDSGRESGALKIFRSMKGRKSRKKPDSYTYQILISHFCSPGETQNLQAAVETLKEMELIGGEARSVYSYGSVINALVKKNEVEKARSLIDHVVKTRDKYVQPNPILYNPILGSYSSKGDSESVMALLNQLKLNMIEPTNVTSIEIFNGFERCGYHTAPKAVEVLDAMAEMFDNFTAHPKTLGWLIDAAGGLIHRGSKNISSKDEEAVPVEDIMEVFEAALDHNIESSSFDIKRTTLNLRRVSTPPGALLALEYALRMFADGGNANRESNGRKKRANIAPGGLFVITKNPDIPFHLKTALGRFNPRIIAIETKITPEELESISSGKSPDKIDPRCSLRISKPSLLRWARAKGRRGYLYELAARMRKNSQTAAST